MRARASVDVMARIVRSFRTIDGLAVSCEGHPDVFRQTTE